jgi:hypothetical protein
VPLEWVKDLSPEDKEKRISSLIQFINSDTGRTLTKVLHQKMADADHRSCSYSDGWQFYQAHLNGYRQMAQEILDLMKFGEE